MLRRPLFALLLILTSCEDRDPPPNRGQVMAAADLLLEHREQAWGPVAHLWEPREHQGRREWQVDYRTGPDGARRIVLVDAVSGWARFPPPAFPLRIQGGTAQVTTIPEGSCLLVVIEAPAGREPELLAEAERLNRAIAGTAPAWFGLRRTRREDLQLVYGWQGDHGIVRTAAGEAVRQWVERRTGHRSVRWLDLAGEP